MQEQQAGAPSNGNLVDGTTKYRRRWWTLGVLSVSLLLIALDVTVLNVAVPTLQQELGASAAQLQWIVNAYVLIFAGLLLTMGSLGDRFGRRLALQAGLLIFGLASLGAGFAESSGELIAMRFIQGIGGALIMPSTLSIIVDVFPREERPQAIGIWAGVAALGLPLGMIAGGWLIEQYSWGWIFFINVPLALAIVATSALLVPESRDPRARGTDLIGAVLSMGALIALVFTLIEAPERGWLSAVTVTGFGVATVLGVLFVAYELRTREPMLNVRFFRNPRLSAGTVAVGVAFMTMLGMMFILTQYLQFARGYSPLETGVRFVPIAVGFMIGAPSSTLLVQRLGGKRIMGSGLVVVAAVMLGLAFLTTETPYWTIGLLLTLLGMGMAWAMAPATDAVMAALPQEQAGVGSALNDTSRQIGGALGIGVYGSILNSVYSSSVGPATTGLASETATAARNSIGTALQAASTAGTEIEAALRTAATDAFLDGLGAVFVVAAVVSLLGGLFIFRFMPARDIRTSEMHPVWETNDVPSPGEPAAVPIPVEE